VRCVFIYLCYLSFYLYWYLYSLLSISGCIYSHFALCCVVLCCIVLCCVVLCCVLWWHLQQFVGCADRLLELTIHYLLKHGADSNFENADGHTPLFIACQLSVAHNIVRWLLAAHALPNPSLHSLSKRLYFADQQSEAVAALQAQALLLQQPPPPLLFAAAASAVSAPSALLCAAAVTPSSKLKLGKLNPNRSTSNPNSLSTSSSSSSSSSSTASTTSTTSTTSIVEFGTPLQQRTATTSAVAAAAAARLKALNPEDAPMPSSYVDIALALQQPAVVLCLLKAGVCSVVCLI
jgi:hypothetical protein